MSESSNVVPFSARRTGAGSPAPELSDFMFHPDIPGPHKQRVVWYTSPQAGGPARVLISWEAQCAIGKSTEMTTDEIFGACAAEFDKQIGLMIARKPAAANHVWTFDADDIVTFS